MEPARAMPRIGDDFPPLPPGQNEHSRGILTCADCGRDYPYRVVVGQTLIWLEGKCLCASGPSPEERRREAMDRAARIQAEVDKAFGHWNLLNDEAYEHMTLDSYKPADPDHEKALKICREYKPDQGNIMFLGPAGRGKTHLAVGILRKMRVNGYSVLAIKSHDIFNRLRKAYAKKDDDYEFEVVSALRNVGILLIDDVGFENGRDWASLKFYEIIDFRSGRRPTFYTTNLNGDELKKRKGEALASRMGAKSIEIRLEGGRDYRLKDNQWWEDIGTDVGMDPERR